jgi:hypothetical protein
MPIMQVVDPAAMQVRVKVNQADVHVCRSASIANFARRHRSSLQVTSVVTVGTTAYSTRVASSR